MHKKRTFLAFIICSTLLINFATVLATESGYTRIEYMTVTEPVIDGAWTSEDEWTDAGPTDIDSCVYFRSTYTMVSMDPIEVNSNFIVESLNDDTDDAGDYLKICIDGLLDGGSAPQADDFKIEIIGHGTPTVYQGDGSGWTAVTPEAGDLVFAESLTDSPMSSAAHWIAEFTLSKSKGLIQMGEQWGLLIEVYDETNDATEAWPPTDSDVPDTWGLNDYTMDPYEGDEPEPEEPEPEEPEPENVAPTASFTYSPASPQVNDTITFDASGSNDSDGEIVSYSWDFGDGTTSTAESPTHSYDKEGSYTVTLTVTDDGGLTDDTSKTITDVVIPEFSSYAIVTAAMTVVLMLGIQYRKKMGKDK
ncbi:MAG: PKD domain-containing protein [archaeon]